MVNIAAMQVREEQRLHVIKDLVERRKAQDLLGNRLDELSSYFQAHDMPSEARFVTAEFVAGNVDTQHSIALPPKLLIKLIGITIYRVDLSDNKI